MNKILVPVDFSACSIKGVEMAVEIAKSLNSTVVMYHLVPSNMGGFDTGYPSIEMRVEMMQREADKEKLNGLAERYSHECYTGTQNPIKIETKVEFGELSISLKLFIEEEGVDMVVVGTEGSKGLVHDWMGTNAYDIVNATNIPVLVVPKDAEIAKIEQIVFATSFEKGDSQAVTDIELLASRLDADLRILHVTVGEQGGVYADIRMEDNLAGHTHALRYTQITAASALEGITAFIEAEKTDILCLLRPERGFWEGLMHQSLTKAMVLHANLPILILKEKA